jgi:hypothetical protein
MSGSAERFVALLVGIIAILGGLAGIIKVLVTISWKMGQLIQQYNDHVTRSDKIHTDFEERMRRQELGGRRPR